MRHATVLLVTPESTQHIAVNARLLRWHQPLLIALVVTTALLTLILGVLAWNYLSDADVYRTQTQRLKQEVTNLQNFTSAEIQSKLKTLQKSQHVVDDMQRYLRERGVPVKPLSAPPAAGAPNPAAGGPEVRMTRPLPLAQGFAQESESLLHAVQGIPLGTPHPGDLSSRFGGRANPFTGAGSEFHTGLDFKGTTGDPVRATARGQVTVAGWQNGYGNHVQVLHANGYSTLYGHLSKVSVRVGQTIEPGDEVGLLGSTGRSTGPHLHYEVLQNGQRVDPERYLSLTDTPAADL